ncbi:alpha/beta hydrolase [Micromonospora carbonacea]|uniref:alpha/beta hydrolase n=1 Tax=Micromonospora carbonacea TaxID=47853 RepID=UPI003722D6ED
MTASSTDAGIQAHRVTFDSAGETLAGSLYLPGHGDPSPGLVIAGPWRTVKEQVPSVYAELMARRGFAALAFDFRGWGQSSGRPMRMEDPFSKADDIVAAAAFLAGRPEVIARGVGGLGVCAGSGYLARAAALSDTIRSVALVAPGLPSHPTVVAEVGGEAGVAAIERLAHDAREAYDRTGQETLVTAVPATPESTVAGADYYTNPQRGLVPAWDNLFNPASWTSWLTFDAQDAAPHLTAPLLVISSDAAVSPSSVRQFIAKVPHPVEQIWIPGVPQFDWYDQPGPTGLAADAVAAHFDATLR